MPFAEETKLLKNPAPALRHDSICSTIGSTPLVKLQRSAPPGVNIYVKSEFMNPMGSVKDRLALGMIEFAEQHGLLKPGQTVVEATSGNTGPRPGDGLRLARLPLRLRHVGGLLD